MSNYKEALAQAFTLEPVEFMNWLVQQDTHTPEYTTMAIMCYLIVNQDNMPGPGATL